MTIKATYKSMPNLLAQLESFTHGSHHAIWHGTTYAVYSYRTLIATFDRKTRVIYLDPTKYSMTTSRLQNIIRKSWGL